MADRWLLDSTRRAKAALIDTTMPNWARVGDALFGGRDNFEADRKAVRMLAAAAPVVGAIPAAARAFRQRVVRYLVAEAGIRQFLDVGTSLAMSGNTHEVAQSLAPDCRVVYIDDDPMVLAHARAQLAYYRTQRGGRAGREPERPCRHSRRRGRDPGPWQAGRDPADGHAVVRARRRDGVQDRAVTGRGRDGRQPCRALPSGERPGSGDVRGRRRWNAMSGRRVTLPLRARLTGLLSGLDPVPPGLHARHRMAPRPARPPLRRLVPVYGAVARKP